MPDIRSSGHPLVFRVVNALGATTLSPGKRETTRLRTYVRALQGMQKEAVVVLATSGGQHTWRMVSDEGPYLNGTDLAPFPLAFFSAGMQFSLLSQLLRQAEEEGVRIESLSLVQDNYYTMEGSALQGTMVGGARPVEMAIKIEADASDADLARLIRRALQSCPAQALLRDVLTNRFALTCNEEPLDLQGDGRPAMAQWRDPVSDDLQTLFERVQPDDSAPLPESIITRVSQAKEMFGVEGGAASSLQEAQKRTLHVHGEATWLGDRLCETTVQLYRPIGSTFRFVCDEVAEAGGGESAPPPLAYLSAGIGFCFMTQIGRYAHITKQSLHSYRIIQDNAFIEEDGTAQATPIATHVYLDLDEPDDVACQTVWMSERTCFLHAAMRGATPSIVRAERGGEEIPLQWEG